MIGEHHDYCLGLLAAAEVVSHMVHVEIDDSNHAGAAALNKALASIINIARELRMIDEANMYKEDWK